MSGVTSGIVATKNGEDVDLEFFPGKTLNFSVVWSDNGTPIDITGATAKMQIRGTFGNLIATFSSASGNVTIDGPAGEIAIVATPTQTAVVCEEGVYELEMTTAGGEVYRVISGSVLVSKEHSQ